METKQEKRSICIVSYFGQNIFQQPVLIPFCWVLCCELWKGQRCLNYDQFIQFCGMWSLQQKQKYIRDHIPQQQYVQFWEYIEDMVGNFDLEKWTENFLISLIQQYSHSKLNSHNQHQTSFFHYQANDKAQKQESAKITVSVAPILSQNQFKTTRVNLPPPAKPGPKAVTLLDQILIQAKETIKSTPSSSSMPLSAKGSPALQKVQTPQPSLFASNQFWQMGALTASQPRPKANKSNVDFASFDFWSQPSSANSSPQNFKSANYGSYFEKESDKNKKVNSSVPQQQGVIPSFDQLLLNYQTQKGPSPYLKKSGIDQNLSDKAVEKSEKSLSNVTDPANLKKKQQKVVQKTSQKTSKAKQTTKPGKVLYDGEIILKEEFNDTVKCFQSTERVRLSTPDLRVVIQGHEIVQRTFLFPDYVMYDIRVLPFNVTCKRNYEDFSRLRKTLSKLFPGTKLAYLQKNAWFSSTSNQFVKKQKVMLEYFLNDLIRNHEIKNSRILQDFLTVPEHKKIKRKFEEWQNLQAPKGIEQICWLKGKIEVTLSEQKRLYQDNFSRYHSKLIDFLQKQQKLSETLVYQYQQIEATQKALKDLVNSMVEETTAFNERVYGLELDKIQNSFKSLSKYYNFQEENTRFIIELLNNKLLPFLTYQKQNTAQFSDLLHVQQSFFKSYLKRSNTQKPQQGMPYTSDKIKQFKLGVLQQSKHILVMKYQTAYLSNQTCEQSNKMVENLGEKYLGLLKEYSLQSQHQTEKYSLFWKTLNKSY